MSNTDNKIFKLEIKKTHPEDKGIYSRFEVGESVAALENFIRTEYKINELIKDPEDDFPYFTDGGFKYRAKGEYWHYDFTCYPDNLIAASHSKEQVEGKRDWEIVSFKHNNDPINILEKKEGYLFYWKTDYPDKNPWNLDDILESDSFNIHSVRRISDSVVFSIGDEINFREGEECDWHGEGKIISFSLKSGELCPEIYPKGETSKSGSIFRELINIQKAPERKEPEYTPPPIGIIPEWLWREQRMGELRGAINRYDEDNLPRDVKWAEELSKHAEWFRKRKNDTSETPERTKLFTTEDGREVFSGNDVYGVGSNGRWNVYPFLNLASEQYIQISKAYRFFSTEEAANEYILLNNPCLSVNEIINATIITQALGTSLTPCEIQSIKKLAAQKLKV